MLVVLGVFFWFLGFSWQIVKVNICESSCYGLELDSKRRRLLFFDL